jgi:Na+-driven multidrug efflux pump
MGRDLEIPVWQRPRGVAEKWFRSLCIRFDELQGFGFDQLIGAIFGIAGYLLVMTGHQVTAARVIIGCALLNLVLTFALTPLFGLMGAGIATTIATLARSYLLTARMKAALGLTLSPWQRHRTPD